MFKIYADDYCVYDDCSPDEAYKVISPKLTFEDNAAGSLTMTVPPTNNAYAHLDRMDTLIRVERSGNAIWWGRILSEDIDFWNCRKVTCEGALAFLNDTVQPQKEYGGDDHPMELFDLLSHVITEHNNQIGQNGYRFSVGRVSDRSYFPDYDPKMYRYTDFDITYEFIKTKMIDNFGGHLFVRGIFNGAFVIDYLSDKEEDPAQNKNTQIIRFGENLSDFTRSFEGEDYKTVLFPKGAQEDLDPEDPEYIEGLHHYILVDKAEATELHPEGSLFVYDQNEVNLHGWIVETKEFSECETPAELLAKATEYIHDKEKAYDSVSIEMSALDLNYVNVSVESLKLLDYVRVISEPHYVDKYFPLTKIEIDMENPQSSTYTFGGENHQTFTSYTRYIELEKAEGGQSDIDEQDIINKANAYTNSEIAKVDGAIDAVDGRVDAANSRIDTTNGTVTGIQSQVTQANNGVAAANTRIDNTNTRIDNTNKNVSNLQTEVGKTDGKISSAVTTATNNIKADLTDTLTSAYSAYTDRQVQDAIERVMSESKDQATDVASQFTKGYVTLVQDGDHTKEIVISSLPDYTNEQAKVWVWGSSGLMYRKAGYNSQNVGTAIWVNPDTGEGGIRADMINAGQLNAGLLKAGIIRAAQHDENFQLNLETGELKMANIRIDGGAGVVQIFADGNKKDTRVDIRGDQIDLFVENNKALYLDQEGVHADSVMANNTVYIGNYYWEAYSGGLRLLLS